MENFPEIHGMILGERLSGTHYNVDRVPGGWIFAYGSPPAAVFVPYHDEGFPRKWRAMRDAGFLDDDVLAPGLDDA